MKTILLGMNNEFPDRVFYPDNDACSGGRILKMLRYAGGWVPKEEYLEGFDRINMHYGKEWNYKKAVGRRLEVIEQIQGRRVIIFGRQTASALGVDRSDGFWTDADGYFVYTTLPHPSGLTREYNDAGFRQAVGDLLWEELQHSQK